MRISILISAAVAILLSTSCFTTHSRPETGDRPDLKIRFQDLRAEFRNKRLNDPSVPDLRRKFQSAKDNYRQGNYDGTEKVLDDIEGILSSFKAGSHPTTTLTDSAKYPSNNNVTYKGTGQCPGGSCFTLDVACNDIPARTIYLKKGGASGPSGTVFLTTGGRSNMLYSSQSRDQKATVDFLIQNGYQVFELAWREGWPKRAEGHGFKDAMCGYEKAVRWTVENLADNRETVCAQGNSSGGFQIAYGLAVYGMDDIFDAVIMSGGPPASRFDVSCFGTDEPGLRGAEWADGTAGLGLIDIAMGWARKGDYCKSRRRSAQRERQLQDTSLVSPTESRDYNYKTAVMFVNSENDHSNAGQTARIYYDAINSEKYWYEIEGTEHNVDHTPEGSKLIRKLLLEKCHESSQP